MSANHPNIVNDILVTEYELSYAEPIITFLPLPIKI